MHQGLVGLFAERQEGTDRHSAEERNRMAKPMVAIAWV